MADLENREGQPDEEGLTAPLTGGPAENPALDPEENNTYDDLSAGEQIEIEISDADGFLSEEDKTEPAQGDYDLTEDSGGVPDEDGMPENSPREDDSNAEPEPAAEKKKTAEGLSGIGLAISLCDAVVNAVGRDRFHGGIRPDNISVREERVYLGSTLKHNVGEFTPQELEYMAPELFWDGIRSPAADVYSLGLVLYSVYNYGRLPFWPSSGAVTPNARASALQKRMSDELIIPPEQADAELAAVILRALAFRPEERWQDVLELKDALGSCDETNSPVDISLAMSGLLTRGAEPVTQEQPASRQGKGRAAYYDEGEIPVARRPQRRKNLSWLWIVLLLMLIAGALLLLFSDRVHLTAEPESVATMEPTAEPTQAPTPSPTPEVTPTPEPTRKPSTPKYVVYRENVGWTEAVKRCEEMGGTLAIPANEEELAEIVRLSENQDLSFVWMGASRQADGNWYTPEGEMVSYFPWREGEPSLIDPGDGAAENYLLLSRQAEDEWYFNDSRDNPLIDYGWIYSGNIGYVCQMYKD